MSAISPRVMRDRFTETFLVAVRTGHHHDAYHSSGSLVCFHCGGSAMSMADFAAEIGVSARDVSNFLHRRPVRADVAERIRAHVVRVDE